MVFATGLLVGLPVASARSSRPAAAPAARGTSPGYDKAKREFYVGVRLFNAGHYTKAIAAFRRSLASYFNPKALARIALCYKWLGDNLKALEHYESFLKRFKPRPGRPGDSALHKRVVVEIQNLLRLVSRVRVIMQRPTGAEVQINGNTVGRAPLSVTFRIRPGPVTVTVMAKGYYSFQRKLRLAPNQLAKMTIVLVRIKRRIITKVIRVSSRPIYKRWWFWTVLGTLVAGGVTALGVTLGTQDRPRALTGTPVHLDNFTRN